VHAPAARIAAPDSEVEQANPATSLLTSSRPK